MRRRRVDPLRLSLPIALTCLLAACSVASDVAVGSGDGGAADVLARDARPADGAPDLPLVTDAGARDAGAPDAGAPDGEAADASAPDAAPVDPDGADGAGGADGDAPPCVADGECDDGEPCTIDLCGAGGACRHEPRTGALCDDGDACTTGESCGADGRCGGGAALPVPADPCLGCRCDPQAGLVCAPLGVGALCDDGDCCTHSDRCVACVAGEGGCPAEAIVCRGTADVCADEEACTGDTCECVGGAPRCEHAPVADGTPCELDPNACAEPDTCRGGVCVAGAALPLDDGNACTADRCDKGEVLHDPLTGDQCDDGDACTQDDRCADGACVGGPRVTCDRPVCASSASCVAGQGCVVVWAPAGAACDDGDPCTVGDRCDAAHACVPGTGTPTDDGNPCTADACDPQTGSVTHTPRTGSPCDDGDGCTVDDRCTAQGDCAGGDPAVCDDGQACTADTCADGGCVFTPRTNAPCDDGDRCSVGDRCGADGRCQAGPALPDFDGDGYPDATCPGGTDCADSLGAVNPGAPEVCDSGRDDDCDGATDGADDDCAGPALLPCSYQIDCEPQPGRLCARWPVEDQTWCSEPCARSGDCPTGQICYPVPGSALVGFCATGAGGDLPVGSACARDTQCRSGSCDPGAGVCIDLCTGEGPDDRHCPGAAATCFANGDLATGFAGVCAPNAVLGPFLAEGQACTQGGGVFDSSLCLSGHCDLTYPLESRQLCAPLCSSRRDCPYPDQVCNIVLYSTQRIAAAIPFDSVANRRTRDALLGCYYHPSTENRPLGAACTTAAQCQSGKCWPVVLGDGTDWRCTDYCAADADCGIGMECGFAEVNLVSEWLQDPSLATQPALDSETTLVRLCLFP